jgi:hypothetical protein
MNKYIIINETTGQKIEGYFNSPDEAIKEFEKQEELKKNDLNNNDKIDKKDFSKAEKVLNKAKNLKNNS